MCCLAIFKILQKPNDNLVSFFQMTLLKRQIDVNTNL